jgi:hypothetical protein
MENLMKNLKLAERKKELKELAAYIKANKPTHLSETFRFKHIAYCMARGRTYEQIEAKTHQHNVISEWRWISIKKDIAELQEGFNEDVCNSQG